MARPGNPQPESDPLRTVAFNRAMAEHADGLKTFARRMLSDSVLAEDVAQDAFLALYRHLDQVPESAFRPWLYRVTRNLCLDHLRRRRFKLRLFRDVTKDDDRPVDPQDHIHVRPEEDAQITEMHAAIERAVEDLPPKFREAFVLCEMQGLSYEDAAQAMGCPVKTVSTRLFRARQRLRTALGDLIEV